MMTTDTLAKATASRDRLRAYNASVAKMNAADQVTRVEPIAGGTRQTMPGSAGAMAREAEAMRAAARARAQQLTGEAQAALAADAARGNAMAQIATQRGQAIRAAVTSPQFATSAVASSGGRR